MVLAYVGPRAGKLRHRVRIEEFTPVLDSFGDAHQDPATGEVEKAWQLVATVWAEIKPVNAMNRNAAQQTESELMVMITIRYRSDVDATMRLVHNGTIYDITGLVPDDDSGLEWLQLPCTRGLNAG